MWESSVPINNDNINPMLNNSNRQLINSSSNKSYDQGFQACRSLINRFDSHSDDDDDVVFSDDEDQGGITPKASKRKGPNSLVLQLNVQNIHLAANAPSVKIETRRKRIFFFLF
jgi:hypothetical protein